MMKFRVWDGIKYSYFNFPEDFYKFINSKETFSDVVVEQFTTTLDNEGNEIYEGDVLFCIKGKNTYNNNYLIEKIGTEDGAFGGPSLCPAFPLQQRCTIYDIASETNKFVIIGNKNQNPELIEQNIHT